MVDYYVKVIIIDALCYIFVFLGKRCARHYMVVKFRVQLPALKGNLWGDLNFQEVGGPTLLGGPGLKRLFLGGTYIHNLQNYSSPFQSH